MESDTEHYDRQDTNSWMYRRFELISKLDPLFYENYNLGGQYLMVVKDDLVGADQLMRRGLEFYPEDVSLNWHMGFLWAYEMRDTKKAYPFFATVSNKPNRPAMFDNMFARLKAEVFGARDAYEFALESWRKLPIDSPLKQRLEVNLYSLKAEIDLACLNENKIGCEKMDFEGKPYLNEKGVWKSSKPLIKTRLNFREKKS